MYQDNLIACNAKSSLADIKAKENVYCAQHLEQSFQCADCIRHKLECQDKVKKDYYKYYITIIRRIKELNKQ